MSIKSAWKRYKTRKSKVGIVADLAFLMAVVVVVSPPLRRGVLTYALRMTIVEPDEYDKIVYLDSLDNFTLHNAQGADTMLTFPPSRPMIINVGSIMSPQSRAELRSLNIMADKYAKWMNVYFVSTDEPKDALQYLRRKKYSALRTYFAPDIDYIDSAPDDMQGLASEMIMSEPATIMVDTAGRVRIKKTGAARWTGQKIDKVIMDVLF